MKTLFLAILALTCALSIAQTKIEFWDQQRRGANLFNSVEKAQRLKDAKAFGINVIRLAPDKWLNGRPQSELGDFLVGRPGKFTELPAKDVAYLKSILDDADKAGLKVVLTMLSLPNARWKQHNHDVEERAIWESFEKQDAAVSFWKKLASALKNHPAVVGYNIRNEPSPELVDPKFKDWYGGDYAAWYEKVKGTAADLNLFYRKMVKAIREVDTETPIFLDSGFYGTAWAFKVLEPVSDDKTLYSFHMYEPYAFTNFKNKGKYKYPGKIPTGESDDAPVVEWNRAQIAKYFEPVSEWQKKYKIPSSRVFVGELGVFRENPGALEYLRDVIAGVNANQWHWAFYSFREDTWAGMDYELGTAKAGGKYWEAIEKGKIPGPDVYKKNPISEMLRAALRGS